MPAYDPFTPGPFASRRRGAELLDDRRGRRFPCDVWAPSTPGDADRLPVVLYSHHSGGHRRVATFLCEHLAGHGYVVAAMDHSETVAEELGGREGETPAERKARIESIVSSRVPDLRFLLDQVLSADGAGHATDGLHLDAQRVGLVGHSFGGWAVLATPDVEQRVHAVVAHAPGGSRTRRPGLLPLDLAFAWGRDVPALFLAGDRDVPVPLLDVLDVFERTPATRRLVVLSGADHQHFVDDVEEAHEVVRAMDYPPEAAWIPAAMRPIGELCSGEQAHGFVRALTLAHLDATLRRSAEARRFLDADVESALTSRGIEATAYEERRPGGGQPASDAAR